MSEALAVVEHATSVATANIWIMRNFIGLPPGDKG
jgi:hypothetical protein